jgi:UDP-glucose 4-epimerase
MISAPLQYNLDRLNALIPYRFIDSVFCHWKLLIPNTILCIFCSVGDDMKYFVTGGAGFIGSHIVDRLMKNGNEVTVYDNLSSGRQEFIEHHKDKKNFRFVKGDLLDLELLKETIKDHQFVWHIAANPDVKCGSERTDVDLKNGTLATYNLLEAMRLRGAEEISFASSSVVYGEAKVLPTPEDYGPLIPISLYAAAKLACEGLITAYCHNFGMKSWIFRFANIIGERGTHGIIVDFIEKLKKDPTRLEILGDGKQRKSYLLIEECIDAMFFTVKNSNEEVNIYNLGSGNQIEVSKIAEIIVEELGLKNIKFEYTGGVRGWKGDVPLMLLGTKKINKLGWKNKYSSEEAIRKTVKIIIKERWKKP